MEELKGKEKDEDWADFYCLVETTVAVAEAEAMEEESRKKELEKESRKKKELTGHLKINDNSMIKFKSPPNYFSKKTRLVDTFPRFMEQSLVLDESKSCTTTSTSLMMFSTTELSSWEGKKIAKASFSNSVTVLPKNNQSFVGKREIEENRCTLKRCFEPGETNGVKTPQSSNEKRHCVRIVFTGGRPQQPSLPETFRKMIEAMEGTDVKLIIEKPLFNTDLSSNHCRLSVPEKQVRVEFLTDEEKTMLQSSSKNERQSIEALLIDPSLEIRTVSLRRWKMQKPSGKKTSSIYALCTAWNTVVTCNKLKKNDLIQLWSFRMKSNLCFALVVVRRQSESA